MRVVRIDLPADPAIIKSLEVGDEVRLYGNIITGRDMVHKLLVEEKPDFPRELLRHSFLYHCGPVVRKVGDGWEVVAAGPTTSIRAEPYEADVLNEYQLAGAIGKGGMGQRTLDGLARAGAVYLHAVGGVATLLAQKVRRVAGVHLLEEFSSSEAMWVFEVEDFPAVVTMDSHGNSLHATVRTDSNARLKQLLTEV